MSFDAGRQRVKAGVDDPPAGNVDVIVTTQGGEQTARAVHAGGGLVGIRSANEPPRREFALEGGEDDVIVPLNFIDWPFTEDDPSEERHVDMVQTHEPKYAVAPDVEDGRSLDEVLNLAEILGFYAEHVIVVPKDVPVDTVPEEYIVGMPFRDEWETDLGVNRHVDFQGRPVHILGGNPTEQFEVAHRFDLQVTSIDSPNPLSWADFGRVWVARLGGATEVRQLIIDMAAEDSPNEERYRRRIERIEDELADMDADEFLSAANAKHLQEQAAGMQAALEVPSWRRLLESRSARITFTVMNLREAWNEGREVTLSTPLAPGRGPPPPAPEGLHGEGREEVLERFLQTAVQESVGEIEPSERGLETFVEGSGAETPMETMGMQSRPERTVVLVGCGKAKVKGSAEARNLYTSTYFGLKRAYAEAVGDEWYVLSAKEHVVDPREVIACYDKTMDEVDPATWGKQVLDELPDLSNAEVIVLAGPDYLGPIEAGLEQRAAKVTTPTKGMEIWERQSWLSDNIPDEGEQTTLG